MGAMNATDAAGRYIFGGSQGKSQPFTQVDGRYIYQGDTGDSAARNIQVDHSRVIDVGNPGSDVCLRSAPGALTFLHGRSAHNTGIRSEEHTSELQSPGHLVVRLPLAIYNPS